MINFKRRLLVAGWVILWAATAWAAEIKVPQPQGFVSDYAGVLSAQAKQQLTGLSQSLQAATGAELAFVILPTTKPYDDLTYGMAIFDTWKIGQKGKDNGLLVLLAIKDRAIRIISGYGIEPILPDGKLGRYRDEYLTPFLSQGQVGEGLYNIGLVMAQDIARAAGVPLPGAAAEAPRRSRPMSPWVTLGLLLVMIILSMILARFNRRNSRGHGPYTGGWTGGTFYRGGGGFGGGFGGFGGGFSGGGGVGGRW